MSPIMAEPVIYFIPEERAEFTSVNSLSRSYHKIMLSIGNKPQTSRKSVCRSNHIA